MNRVLVTGAAGFVGSSVVKECVKKGLFVYAVDVVEDPNARIDLSSPNIEYSKLDVFDEKRVAEYLKVRKIDTVFHFAWVGSAGPLRGDSDSQIANAKMTVQLLRSAKESGCEKFICAGTIMEFETIEAVFAQGSKPQASFAYGAGKLLAHTLCKIVSNEIGMNLVWAHITNSFGVGELSPRLINTTIRKCINSGILEFTSAVQNYDFVYIDDVAHAFYLLGEKGVANKSYVIGSGNPRSLRSFLEQIVDICGKGLEPQFGNIPFTGVNLDKAYFSINDLEIDCGYAPRISFEEGIRKTYQWLLQMEGD